MSIEAAKDYVELILGKLADNGVITHYDYGRITESQREALAELLIERSEE